ncbi:MAG: SMP-30/gluconolactonase/LRE family protein [Chitinophagales bacterium]
MSKPIIFLICFLSILSCQEETTSNNFRVPIATNGITYHDDLIWVTDLIGQSITAVDPQTGIMVKQYDFRSFNIGPDDLVFLEDGSTIWTAPIAGKVGKITTEGKIVVLAEEESSINPITQNTVTNEIFIGQQDFGGDLKKINPNSGLLTTVATELPSLNGFAFAEDNLLYAPLFNMDRLLDGYGGIIKINTLTGLFEDWEVSFPEDPNKTKFKNTTAIKSDLNGSIYVLESTTPAVYKVNLDSGEAYRFGTLPSIAADNIALDENDNVYVTTFIQNIVFVFDKDGNRRKITIQN